MKSTRDSGADASFGVFFINKYKSVALAIMMRMSVDFMPQTYPVKKLTDSSFPLGQKSSPKRLTVDSLRRVNILLFSRNVVKYPLSADRRPRRLISVGLLICRNAEIPSGFHKFEGCAASLFS